MRFRNFEYIFDFCTREKFDQLKLIPCKYHVIGSEMNFGSGAVSGADMGPGGGIVRGFLWVVYPKSISAMKKIVGLQTVSGVDKKKVDEVLCNIRSLGYLWESDRGQTADLEREILRAKSDLLSKENTMLREMVLKSVVVVENRVALGGCEGYKGYEGSDSIPRESRKVNHIMDYLTTKCKSAFTFRDFIASIEVLDDDLIYMKDYGYIESASRLLNRSLTRCELYRRPIHCSDMKRSILYVNTCDGWKKETYDDCPTIDRAFRQLSQLHRKKMSDYYHGVDIESKVFEEKARVMYQIACAGGTDEIVSKKKIMKKIADTIRLCI
jgi:hypothetical protein